jgi:hypothetical protein
MSKNKLFGIGWLINIVFLFIIVVMPKDSKLYSVLYPVFMLAVFLVPLLLMVGQYLYLSKSGKVDVFAGVSSVGASIIILMTFINFITAIEKHYRPELVITAFTFVFAELLLGYLVISLKEFNEKKHKWLYVGMYAALVLFFCCAMVMSWDHSIKY